MLITKGILNGDVTEERGLPKGMKNNPKTGAIFPGIKRREKRFFFFFFCDWLTDKGGNPLCSQAGM